MWTVFGSSLVLESAAADLDLPYFQASPCDPKTAIIPGGSWGEGAP